MMDKSRQSSPDGRPGEGLRLLIIDDEPSHAEAVAESLARVGYECVVAITGHGDVQSAVEAMKAGVANFLQKPINLPELRVMVGKAAERFRLALTNQELKQ